MLYYAQGLIDRMKEQTDKVQNENNSKNITIVVFRATQLCLNIQYNMYRA